MSFKFQQICIIPTHEQDSLQDLEFQPIEIHKQSNFSKYLKNLLGLIAFSFHMKINYHSDLQNTSKRIKLMIFRVNFNSFQF